MSLNRRQTRSLTVNNTSNSNSIQQSENSKQQMNQINHNTEESVGKQEMQNSDSKPQLQTRTSLRRSTSSFQKLNNSILSNKTQNSILNETESKLKTENKLKSKTGENCINNSNNVNISKTQNLTGSNQSINELNQSHQSTSNENSNSSQKISTRRRSSNYLNQLRLNNSLSQSMSSSSLDQSISSLNRKRNLSNSFDICNKNENQLNIENLNNDPAQTSSSASSSSSTTTTTTTTTNQLQNLNKRLKLKHKNAFKELSINENQPQTTFRLLSKDEYENSPINETKEELGEDSGLDEKEENEQKEYLLCPVKGCNSEGHLDGVSEHHFTFDTCPIYFEMNKDECVKRKLESDSKLNELKEKINRINENRKNLRNKHISKEQTEYYEKINQELKKKIEKPSNGKLQRLNFLSDNSDIIGDIKNLTTSFIINSISNCLTPTPMPIYHQNAHHHNSHTNFLNNLNQSKAQPPSITDLDVSKFELDLFKDVIQSSTKETLPQIQNYKRLKLVNKTNKIIQFGNYEIETWYKSPYPEDIWQLNKIFICQYCLIYMKSHSVLNRHLEKCLWRHPPGREIYRKNFLSFFEVDGKFNKIYCQNLCLLAKLFLDHKTLYYDVEPFLFYVLTQYNEETGSFQMIGYFSKEKQSVMNYNLSCILILPQFMNKGYGRVLIDFSYLLSRVEGKIGSPERPLSDLGLISYRSYWKSKLLFYLANHIDDMEISVKEISAETGILTNDLISTLQFIGLIKYWKGKHVILKDKELIEKYLEHKKLYTQDVDPVCLKWTPYVYQTIINESETLTHSVYVKGNKLNHSTT